MNCQTEKDIRLALASDPVDINRLKCIARREGGFCSNKLRSRIWPKLLGVNRYDIIDYKTLLCPHRDKEQLRCDIERSLWSFDSCKYWDEHYLLRKRLVLQEIITAVLCTNQHLYYFQGFHDIVSVVMLVLNDDVLTYGVIDTLASQYFIDYMGPDFEMLPIIMKFISSLIKVLDVELYEFLHRSGTEPYFATSWILTWLSHDVRSLDEIARIFDVMLCSHPIYCLYISAAVCQSLHCLYMH